MFLIRVPNEWYRLNSVNFALNSLLYVFVKPEILILF